MRKMKRLSRRAAGLVLAVALACSGALLYAVADAANDWFNAKPGELSAAYETNPNYGPGSVSTVQGDPGGTSYGLYMFTRNADTPRMFFRWLLQQTDNAYYLYLGQQLEDAYNHDVYGNENPGYGTNFDNTWQALSGGDNDPDSPFGQAQTAFTKARFFDALVEKLEKAGLGFKMANYSIALENVLWSRAVQHGVEGAYNVVTRAMNELGGFKNQSESDLITAIYAESGKVTTGYANVMSGDQAKKYGVEGKSLAYYTGCSGAVQMSVFMRLNFKEPTDAQMMLFNNQYINESGSSRLEVDEGTYRLSDSDSHYLLVDSGKLTLGSEGTDLALTYFASGYYTVTFSGTDMRLSVTGGVVVPESASAAETQMWRLENVNGGYTLQNRGSGKYLTILSDDSGKRLGLTDEVASATPWRFDLAGNGWSTSAMHVPSEATALEEGNSGFAIWGTIRSSSKITRVDVSTRTASGAAVYGASTVATPNSYIYNLNKLDNIIKISALKEGQYVFTVKATNAAGDTVTLVESPFTVYAPSKITVTFDPNGGAITTGSATKTITAGSVYGDLPVASIQGGAFLGWFTERTGGEAVSVTDVPPMSNHTLYAHYANTHTVTFKDRSGNVISTAALAPGAVISAPANPGTWSDGSYAYTFKQWVSGSTVLESGVTVMGESDLVFTPEFNKQALSGGSTGGSTGGGSTGGGSTGGSTGGGVTVGGSELTGFVPGTSVSSFSASMGATVYKADGVTQVTSGNIATGMIAKIGGSSYTIVVKGDANGDGAMSISDVVKLQSHVVGRASLSGAYATAGDLNGDGKISITDVVQAAQVVVGKRTLG